VRIEKALAVVERAKPRRKWIHPKKRGRPQWLKEYERRCAKLDQLEEEGVWSSDRDRPLAYLLRKLAGDTENVTNVPNVTEMSLEFVP
jgi:hypothetical protein